MMFQNYDLDFFEKATAEPIEWRSENQRISYERKIKKINGKYYIRFRDRIAGIYPTLLDAEREFDYLADRWLARSE